MEGRLSSYKNLEELMRNTVAYSREAVQKSPVQGKTASRVRESGHATDVRSSVSASAGTHGCQDRHSNPSQERITSSVSKDGPQSSLRMSSQRDATKPGEGTSGVSVKQKRGQKQENVLERPTRPTLGREASRSSLSTVTDTDEELSQALRYVR